MFAARDSTEINTHASSVNVAAAVTVHEQNVTVGGTAEVVKWEITNNYHCDPATPATSSAPAWARQNLAYSYKIEIFNRWRSAQGSLQRLEQTLLDYKPGYEKHGSQEPTLERAKRGVEAKLKTVTKENRRGVKIRGKTYTLLKTLDQGTGHFFAWLDCLPAQHYGSLLCGAIQSILTAILNGKGPPEPVVEVMTTTIIQFDLKSDYMRLNPNARAEMRETFEIFATLVRLFSQMIEHGRPQTRLQGSSYKSMKSDMDIIKDHLESASRIARNMHRVEHDSDARHIPWQDTVNELLCNNASSFSASSPQYKEDCEHSSSLSKGIPNEQDKSEAEGPSIAALPSSLSPHGINRLSKDIEECSSPSTVSSNKVMQPLSSLTGHDAVQHWLRETSQASALLIHGHFQADSHISPISYLCAQISKEYKGRPDLLVLSYFCSLHVDDNHKKSSPATMLISLIDQLLSHPFYEAPSNEKNDLIKGLKKQKIKLLCKMFKFSIKELLPTNTVVFCLIDSISYYEAGVHQAHVRIILDMMTSLVRSQSGRKRGPEDKMVFKLMVTDGLSSLCAYDYFKTDQIVDIVDSGNGSKVSELGTKS